MPTEVSLEKRQLKYRNADGDWIVVASGLRKVRRVDNWEDKGVRKSGLLICTKTKSGAKNEVFLPAATLRGKRMVIPELCDAGIDIKRDKTAEQVLIDYLLSTFDNDRALVAVQNAGWQEDETAFVTSNGLVIGSNPEIKLQFAWDRSSENDKEHGLREWQETVGVIAEQSTTMVVSVAVALSSCLLKTTRIEPFWLHIYGQSSIGKTLVLMLAYSVFHDAQRGRLPTMDFTEAGLEELAAKHNDQVAVLDELDQLTGNARERSKRMGLVIHRIAGGASRLRSKHYDQSNVFTWRTIVFSSGEISISQLNHQAQRRRNSGEELRIVDMPAITGKESGVFDRCNHSANGRKLASKLERAIETHGSILGPSFIEALLAKRKDNNHTINDLITEFLSLIAVGDDNREYRYAKKFALGYAAGVLACRLGILKWDENAVRDAFIKSYSCAISAPALSPAVPEKVIAAILARCSDPEKFVERKDQRDAGTFGYRRYSKNGHEYLLLSARRFRRLCGEEISPLAAAEFLRERHILKAGADGKLTRQARISGERQRKRYYWLRVDAFKSAPLGRRRLPRR